MRKTILSILIILVTVILTILLVNYMGLLGFAFAWTLNFLLMMGVFFFTETLKSPLSSSYFETHSWEKNGKIYTSFGVHFFRKLLVLSGWEKMNKKANPIEKNSDALQHLFYRTEQSELGHIIIFIIVSGFTFFVAFRHGILQSMWLFGLNIILNFYPILVQRFNRPRLKRALLISNRKASL